MMIRSEGDIIFDRLGARAEEEKRKTFTVEVSGTARCGWKSVLCRLFKILAQASQKLPARGSHRVNREKVSTRKRLPADRGEVQYVSSTSYHPSVGGFLTTQTLIAHNVLMGRGGFSNLVFITTNVFSASFWKGLVPKCVHLVPAKVEESVMTLFNWP